MNVPLLCGRCHREGSPVSLNREIHQEQILEKGLKFYVVDAYKVAREAQMGVRINTVMQTCFFAMSGVLPRDEAIAAIKRAIARTYGKRGEPVVRRNDAVTLDEIAADKVTDTVLFRKLLAFFGLVEIVRRESKQGLSSAIFSQARS